MRYYIFSQLISHINDIGRIKSPNNNSKRLPIASTAESPPLNYSLSKNLVNGQNGVGSLLTDFYSIGGRSTEYTGPPIIPLGSTSDVSFEVVDDTGALVDPFEILLEFYSVTLEQDPLGDPGEMESVQTLLGDGFPAVRTDAGQYYAEIDPSTSFGASAGFHFLRATYKVVDGGPDLVVEKRVFIVGAGESTTPEFLYQGSEFAFSIDLPQEPFSVTYTFNQAGRKEFDEEEDLEISTLWTAEDAGEEGYGFVPALLNPETGSYAVEYDDDVFTFEGEYSQAPPGEMFVHRFTYVMNDGDTPINVDFLMYSVASEEDVPATEPVRLMSHIELLLAQKNVVAAVANAATSISATELTAVVTNAINEGKPEAELVTQTASDTDLCDYLSYVLCGGVYHLPPNYIFVENGTKSDPIITRLSTYPGWSRTNLLGLQPVWFLEDDIIDSFLSGGLSIALRKNKAKVMTSYGGSIHFLTESLFIDTYYEGEGNVDRIVSIVGASDSSVGEDIEALAARVTSAETSLSQIQIQVTTNASSLEDLENADIALQTQIDAAKSGEEFTGAFAIKDISSGLPFDFPAQGWGANYIQYEPARAVAGTTQEKVLPFSLDAAVQQYSDDNSTLPGPLPDHTGVGHFGGAFMPPGVTRLFDFNVVVPGGDLFTGNDVAGSIDLSQVNLGDQIWIRMDYAIIPQVQNTRITPVVWMRTRDGAGNIVSEFELAGVTFTPEDSTIGQETLIRATVSAYVASELDLNALLHPAIRSDRTVRIKPLTLRVIVSR
jgi:hypothetical protein